MNQSELIEAVAGRLGGDRRAANSAVRTVLSVIHDTVAAGEKVAVIGFGTWERRIKPARQARNPANGQIVDVPERAAVAFKPGSSLTAAAKASHASGK